MIKVEMDDIVLKVDFNLTDKIGVSIESLYTDETDRNIEILSNNQ